MNIAPLHSSNAAIAGTDRAAATAIAKATSGPLGSSAGPTGIVGKTEPARPGDPPGDSAADGRQRPDTFDPSHGDQDDQDVPDDQATGGVQTPVGQTPGHRTSAASDSPQPHHLDLQA